MTRRRSRLSPRYVGVPAGWHPRLQRISAIAGVLSFAVAVALLGATAYRTGFSPLDSAQRTGTVTVGTCIRLPSQLWLMRECTATVDRWNSDAQPGGALGDSASVRVLSRSALAGRIEVASYPAATNRVSGTSSSTVREVIMPSTQRPLGDGAKLLLILVCLLTPFAGTLLGGRLAWEIARRLSGRRPPAGGPPATARPTPPS